MVGACMVAGAINKALHEMHMFVSFAAVLEGTLPATLFPCSETASWELRVISVTHIQVLQVRDRR